MNYLLAVGFGVLFLYCDFVQAENQHRQTTEEIEKWFIPYPIGEVSEAKLQSMVQADPEDPNTRFSLLVRASKAEEYDRHVMWFVKHHPEHHVFDIGFLGPTKDSAVAQQVRKLWESHLAEAVNKENILAHGATFYYLAQPELAKEWFRIGRDLEPTEPYWLRKLGYLTSEFKVMEWNSPSTDQNAATKALGYFEKALELSSSFFEGHELAYIALISLASGNYEKADLYANEALKELRLPEKGKGRLPHMNYTVTRHISNIVKGRIALERNDVDQATENLLASLLMPIDHQKGDFFLGADLFLAADILDRGRDQAVLGYLGKCEQNLRVDSSWFDDWESDIKNGNSGDVVLELRAMGNTAWTIRRRREENQLWFYP